MNVSRAPRFLVYAWMAFSIGCAGSMGDDVKVGDAEFDSFIVDGAADNMTNVEEGSSEALAILEVVNTYSRHRLVRDANLHWPAATNLVRSRVGEDDIRGTDDDSVFMELQSVDDVRYVGKIAFGNLRKYVRDANLIARHQVSFDDEIPENIVSMGAAFRGTLKAKQEIKIPFKASAGDRLRFWLRKADDKQWNPRIRLYDGSKRVFSENPWGNTDARLPKPNQSWESGYELSVESDDFVLRLANTSKISGPFEMTVECVGGPCFVTKIGGDSDVLDGNFEGLQNGQLRQQIVARHQLVHNLQTYYNARFHMFTDLDNFEGAVQGVYTGSVIETDVIPNLTVMSAEHTWPQSHGAFDGAARSDLHHIFPATGVANSIRANFPFCNVSEVIRQVDESALGLDENGTRCFEVRDAHKGNVARAMFYFAATYEQTIDSAEESVLRAWDIIDPIDENERARNDAIAAFQGSRNLFIDQPALIDRIEDF